MKLDFDQLSSSDEDLSKKKQREKRIRQDMAEHKSATRVMNTFENRYNAQMKMLQEQNRLLKGFFLFVFVEFSLIFTSFVHRTTTNDRRFEISTRSTSFTKSIDES